MLTRSRRRHVLDTNVAIAWLNGEPAALRHWQRATEVLLPAPVLGELHMGARRSERRRDNEARIRDLMLATGFIPCEQQVCRYYGAIKAALLSEGTPLPDNDIWIAACCVVAGAILVSRDAHFDAIPGLQREEWR